MPEPAFNRAEFLDTSSKLPMILNVDDDPPKRYVWTQLLRANGFHVGEAATGTEALRMIKAFAPSLVLLDVNLPDMSGLEVCKRIKKDPSTESIPVLHISSTFWGTEDKVEGLDNGADAYLSSSESPDVVIATIRALLRAREAEVERLNRELARRAHEFERLFEVLPLAVSIGEDAECKVIRVNPFFAKLLGLPVWGNAAKAAEKTDAPPFKFLREGREVPVDELPQRQAVARRTDIRDTELDVVRADGKRFHLMGQAAPLFDENGDVRGSFGVFMDFTERKQLEEKLAEQAAELRRTNQDLREFVSVVSHDLQAPLNAIINLAGQLKEGAEGELDGDNSDLLSFLLDSATRTKAMFTDVLAWAKVESVDRTSFRPIESRGALEWALLNLKDEIQVHKVEVTYDEMPEVLSERGQLAAVFQNLIGNSIKYRGAVPPRIHVSAERREKEWLFRVADNGIGLDAVHGEYIFGLFRRLHGTEFPGTGVGLAICKRIVERHGGRIWVESQPNQGATFYFTIPGADASEKEPRDEKVRRAGA